MSNKNEYQKLSFIRFSILAHWAASRNFRHSDQVAFPGVSSSRRPPTCHWPTSSALQRSGCFLGKSTWPFSASKATFQPGNAHLQLLSPNSSLAPADLWATGSAIWTNPAITAAGRAAPSIRLLDHLSLIFWIGSRLIRWWSPFYRFWVFLWNWLWRWFIVGNSAVETARMDIEDSLA